MSSEKREEFCGKSTDLEEENSVKNLASMFNQPAQPLSTPAISAKPSITPKPGKLDLDNNIKLILGPTIRSPITEKSANGVAKSPGRPSLASKPGPTAKPSPQAKPSYKVPMGGPVLAGAKSADILNIKSQLKKAPIPRPPPSSTPSDGGGVDFRRSLKKSPVAPPPKPKFSTPGQKSETPDEAHEDSKETLATEGESSSLSSFTSDSSITRRGSSSSQKTSVGNKRPLLEPLPPLETLGLPPPKPTKPGNVKLPKSAVPPPKVGRKPSLPKTARKPLPSEASDEGGEIYDDVDVAVDNKPVNKRISLIPTMDSDEEDSAEELYDDTDIQPSPALPPLPPVPSIQTTVPQTSGSDDGPQEIYDDVSLEGESEELYEALDVSMEDAKARPPSESIDSTDIRLALPESPRKTSSVKSKQEEKQRKEQEKLEQQRRKKEEEARKKREKEEKKRREKEEKEMKKKFNIKGDIRILDVATVIQDCGSDYEKADLVCKRGDRLEVLRREGNPPGKWLVRDSDARYGFVDSDFVAVENDIQETYDDVIPCDESGSEEEEEPQEIYEALD